MDEHSYLPSLLLALTSVGLPETQQEHAQLPGLNALLLTMPACLGQIRQLWQPELFLIIYCSFCSLGRCNCLLGFVPFHFQASVTPELQFHVVL